MVGMVGITDLFGTPEQSQRNHLPGVQWPPISLLYGLLEYLSNILVRLEFWSVGSHELEHSFPLDTLLADHQHPVETESRTPSTI